ncbi:MAG: hypothetical protein HXS42_02960 [Theionarchaea archaeon]|nr:hypothetical protein [Theionarchaea archaeon]MBU7039829.1 hypothetical protein [Theionarchaea archaeon]
MSWDSFSDGTKLTFNYFSRVFQRIKRLFEKKKPVLINLTPHDVVIRQGSQDIIIPRSGKVARVKETERRSEVIEGVDITEISYDKTVNLPCPQENTFYIVSVIVAFANKDRRDLVFPDGLHAYRDENGQIEAVPGLRRLCRPFEPARRIVDLFTFEGE